MKCLKNLACAMLVSMTVVCAEEEVDQTAVRIVLNSKNQTQITACIDALEMAYPYLGTTVAALKVQDLPEAIRLLTLAAANDDQMGLLSILLGSVKTVHENCEDGQSDDEAEELDEEKIYTELARRQRLLDARYAVTDSYVGNLDSDSEED